MPTFLKEPAERELCEVSITLQATDLFYRAGNMNLMNPTLLYNIIRKV
jgi:hypothetical protein